LEVEANNGLAILQAGDLDLGGQLLNIVGAERHEVVLGRHAAKEKTVRF
jgi:hypothetical protein